MQSYDLIFDLIEVVAGLYILYQAYTMKRTGSLQNSGLISRSINLVTAPDIPGFIRLMFPIYICCGAVFLVIGGISMWFDTHGGFPSKISLIFTGILLFFCVGLAFMTHRAQKKFLL